MSTRNALFALAGCAAALFDAAIASAQVRSCSPPNLVEWPAENPVWRFCWVAPDSSSGPDGSGIEIRHAFYNNRRVFWRANMPVLNVLYDAGATCGPTYRDWMTTLRPFDANNVISPGYAEPTVTPTTVCDHPGSDAGAFSGVAIERHADRVILTSQMEAGWYRYIQKWIFHRDGTVQPQMGFTAVNHFCVNQPHSHHGYFRFDFDIEGAPRDQVRQRNRFLWWSWWRTLRTEATKLRAASGFRRWRVVDKISGRGVEIRPGTHDGVGGDPFGGADVWALLFKPAESDDGGSTGGASGDAQHIDPFVDGEQIDDRDVVLWYRVGHRHTSGLNCELTGPDLRLVGSW